MFTDTPENIAPENIAQSPEERLLGCLKYLASRCDFAKDKDNVGYNGVDALFGHELAERATLTYKQQIASLKMLRKYAKQLERGGYRLPEAIPAPVVEAPTAPPSSNLGSITAQGEQVVISFPSIPSESDRSFLKTFKGWQYNGATRTWSVPLAHADAITARFPTLPLSPALAEAKARVQAEKEAEQEREERITQHLLEQAGDLSAPLPNGRVLYAYQQEGVRQLLAKRRVILADDMGLGKTLQSLVAAKAIQNALCVPVWVICPASLKENWKREAEGVQVSIEVFSWAKLPQLIEGQPFVLIADEAHYAQSGTKSKRGAAFIDLARNSECIAAYCLTGTPIKNGRPTNLFPLLQAVKHPLADAQRAFEERYCAARSTRWTKWDVTGASHLDELHVKVKDCMIRRTKKECLTDLPEKTRTLRRAELSASARDAYNDAFETMRAEYSARVRKGEIMSNAEALVLLTHLRHAGSIAKVECAVEIAQEILEQDEQVVMFTEYTDSLRSIRDALAPYGVSYLTGETPTQDRQQLVDDFQAGKNKVFLSTIRAGGVGITLTAASNVILVDRPWTPGDAAQSEDRCHRIGQKSAVNTLWLQANGTDEKIDAVLTAKEERIDLVLAGKRKTMRGLENIGDIAADLLEELMVGK
jgi:SNF2 family DNA or RNA helicase